MHGAGNAQASINDRAGLYVGILGVALAALSLGIISMLPAFIDAKIQAGVASAEMSANEARRTAKINEDKLTELRIQLMNAQGTNVRLDGH